jgi:hypothetical protein
MVDFALLHIPIHESTCIQHDIGIEPINVTIYWWMIGKLYYLAKIQLNFQYVINIVSWHMHAFQIDSLTIA